MIDIVLQRARLVCFLFFSVVGGLVFCLLSVFFFTLESVFCIQFSG